MLPLYVSFTKRPHISFHPQRLERACRYRGKGKSVDRPFGATLPRLVRAWLGKGPCKAAECNYASSIPEARNSPKLLSGMVD